jgi:SAM-dependent methyltransferase
MSDALAQWLALREPYDRAARSRAVLEAVIGTFAAYPAMTVTDIGCGTGSTLRTVSPLLPAKQSWRLVDIDPALLAIAKQTAPSGITVATVATDLARDLESVLETCDLVTTSALLDLVSQSWLERLVAQMALISRPFYAALSYDGRVSIEPGDRHDAAVLAAFNSHQRTVKGFGPALGPDAVRAAIQLFDAAGFAVVEDRADWQFEPDDREIQLELLAGYAAPAREMGMSPAVLEEWMEVRKAHLAAGRSRIRVGHIDFFARPTGRR